MNLSTNINFDLKSFFQWWGDGLSYCLPEKFRVLLSEKVEHVFLTVNDETFQLYRIENDNKKLIAEIPLSREGAEQFQQIMLSEPSLEKACLVLRLKAGQGLKKIVTLPAAAKENLTQVIVFEMDKITPFKEEQVYFSVRPLVSEHKDFIKVLLVLTLKEELNPILQQLKQVNVFPSVVEYAEASHSGESGGYNLLPESERPVKNKMTQILFWVSGFILLMLTVAALVYPVWRMGEAVDGLRTELRQIEKQSHSIQARQLATDNIVDETERLIQSKNNSASLTGLLNTLSQLIPSDTWLTHFKYDKGQLQIQGQSPAASALISILEAAPLFNNARFVSPLTQDKKTGLERFQISVEVNRQGGVANE